MPFVCQHYITLYLLKLAHMHSFWVTAISNGLPDATGPLSCLSVTLV